MNNAKAHIVYGLLVDERLAKIPHVSLAMLKFAASKVGTPMITCVMIAATTSGGYENIYWNTKGWGRIPLDN